ncbi:MAG: hypothetical protein MI806_23685 [Minwuiales bacterium]|nr:hypothetical protein [Minwuiales bacterium]
MSELPTRSCFCSTRFTLAILYSALVLVLIPMSVTAADKKSTSRNLEKMLEDRDAVILELLERVEELERAVSGSVRQSALDLTPAASINASVSRAATGLGERPRATGADVIPSASYRTAASEAPTEQAPPPVPGEFDVDEDAIDRALERTLVQEGALLLPFGKAQIEPSFGYTRRENDAPVFFTEGVSTFLAERDVRRDEFEVELELRIGLPWDAQFEVGLPYNFVDQSTVTRVVFSPRDEQNAFGSGLGDFRIGLAKALLREGLWWPDLVGRVTWDSDTGETFDDGVALGAGFNEIRGSLTAVKRQDPLAFVASFFYESSFEDDDVEPGDEVGFSVGAVLAASPSTSLRFFFDQQFSQEAEVDGDTVDGSDRTVGSLTIGASSVLGRGVLLDLAGVVGLTDDGPEYAVIVSLPIRFDLPAF